MLKVLEMGELGFKSVLFGSLVHSLSTAAQLILTAILRKLVIWRPIYSTEMEPKEVIQVRREESRPTALPPLLMQASRARAFTHPGLYPSCAFSVTLLCMARAGWVW